jgi:uncharacterized membrane protein YeiH
VIAFEVLAQSDASQQTIEDALGVVQTIVQYAGTIAFAISAALLAGRRKMNVVGAMVFGVIVATGGGTLRDVLLGRLPLYWVDDPTALIVAAVAAVVTIPLFKIGTISVMARYDVMRVADSAGLALFAVSGTNIALDSGAGSVSAVVVGVVAGVGGGIIRDVVAQRIPLVLSSGRLYASVAVVGCAARRGPPRAVELEGRGVRDRRRVHLRRPAAGDPLWLGGADVRHRCQGRRRRRARCRRPAGGLNLGPIAPR